MVDVALNILPTASQKQVTSLLIPTSVKVTLTLATCIEVLVCSYASVTLCTEELNMNINELASGVVYVWHSNSIIMFVSWLIEDFRDNNIIVCAIQKN